MSTRPFHDHDGIATELWLDNLVPRYGRYAMERSDLELMICVGDTKAGTLIAKDRYGNKYYENLEDELPCERLQLLFRDDMLNGYSAHTMGRLQGRRVRSVKTPLRRDVLEEPRADHRIQITYRAWMACLDFIHG
jgi:hypothetical protein